MDKDKIKQAIETLSPIEIEHYSKPQMNMDLYRQNFSIYNANQDEFIIFNAIHANILILNNIEMFAPGMYSGDVLKSDSNFTYRVKEKVYFYKERIRRQFKMKLDDKEFTVVSIDKQNVKHEEDAQVEFEEFGGDF
jgi:hypothetical protein